MNKIAGQLEFSDLPSPVERITGIWKFVRSSHARSTARSLPGHLLHLVEAGSYHLKTNAREYDIHAGDVIYYHESEEVECKGTGEVVEFCSVGFFAPLFAPLPLDMRVFASNKLIRRGFSELLSVSAVTDQPRRSILAHGALLKILAEIEQKCKQPYIPQKTQELWWSVEEELRRQQHFRPTLHELAIIAKCSAATISRSCKKTTGKSPISRIRQLRMAEARGLLRFSTLTVTQVALYLGYSRLHEFSREFSRFFKTPPSKIAK